MREFLSQRDLRERAEELRRSFLDEGDNAQVSTCFLDDEGKRSPPEQMDAGERKWSAAKLLRPVDIATAADLDGLSEEDVQMVHEEYWSIAAGRMDEKRAPDRYRHLAAQFAETTTFVRRAWGMAYGPRRPK